MSVNSIPLLLLALILAVIALATSADAQNSTTSDTTTETSSTTLATTTSTQVSTSTTASSTATTLASTAAPPTTTAATTSTAAPGTWPSCTWFTNLNDCVSPWQYNNSERCMVFSGMCVAKCIAITESSACTAQPHCATGAGPVKCVPNCALIVNSSTNCSQTRGCFSYNGWCKLACQLTDATTCATAPHCMPQADYKDTWRACLPKCELAPDVLACNFLMGDGACIWDRSTGRCVVNCLNLGASGCTAHASRCRWAKAPVLNPSMGDTCVTKCDILPTMEDCNNMLNFFACSWQNGRCRADCMYLDASTTGSVNSCDNNPYCAAIPHLNPSMAATGAKMCVLNNCGVFSSVNDCNYGFNKLFCQWDGSASMCKQACIIAFQTGSMQCPATPLCSNMTMNNVTYCYGGQCSAITNEGTCSRNGCMYYGGVCATACVEYSTEAECGMFSSTCGGWRMKAGDDAMSLAISTREGMKGKCLPKCSGFNQAACEAPGADDKCAWTGTACVAQCNDRNTSSACASDGNCWWGASPMKAGDCMPSCALALSETQCKTTFFSEMVGVCRWDTASAKCVKTCPLMTQAECSTSTTCAWNATLSLCLSPPPPIVTTPAPTTTLATTAATTSSTAAPTSSSTTAAPTTTVATTSTTLAPTVAPGVVLGTMSPGAPLPSILLTIKPDSTLTTEMVKAKFAELVGLPTSAIIVEPSAAGTVKLAINAGNGVKDAEALVKAVLLATNATALAQLGASGLTAVTNAPAAAADDFPIIPVAAGAGGGLLLIIVVVAVIMSKKGAGGEDDTVAAKDYRNSGKGDNAFFDQSADQPMLQLPTQGGGRHHL